MRGKDKIEKLFVFVEELTIRLDKETEQRKETLGYACDMKRVLDETFDLTKEQEVLVGVFKSSFNNFMRSK